MHRKVHRCIDFVRHHYRLAMAIVLLYLVGSLGVLLSLNSSTMIEASATGQDPLSLLPTTVQSLVMVLMMTYALLGGLVLVITGLMLAHAFNRQRWRWFLVIALTWPLGVLWVLYRAGTETRESMVG